MDQELTPSQLKRLTTLIIIFAISAVVMVGYSFEAQAQKSGFFIANKKRINIDSLNKQINYWMSEVGVPALSFAVISNNQIVFSGAYGNKRQGDKKKVNRRTIFEACSMTKSYLVFVVYQLVDKGEFDLDKPMYQYLYYKPLEHDPRYKLITPRMILSHSSGIENWAEMNDPNRLEILTNPGEKFVYSGEGYQYLAKVIEKIVNKPYERYIQEMVIKPLKLKRTFTSYKFKGKIPINDATGHNAFGKPLNNQRNLSAVPAAGTHFIAKDYAKLIISTFDRKHLSNDRIRDLLDPIVKMQEVNTSLYYGPGFEIIYSANDTIISQGGSNSGFKNLMFYSVVNKSGFVFLTNSDRGKALAAKLCKATVGLNINPKFEHYYFEQYPSAANDLLKIYKENNAEKMFLKIEELKKEGKINGNTLVELGDVFLYEDRVIAKRLLETNLELYPKSADSYLLMGLLNMKMKNYKLAEENFRKAEALNLSDPLMDYAMKICKVRIMANASIKSWTVNIDAKDVSTIQAENYSAMSGVDTAPITDNGSGVTVLGINTDDWMEYKIETAKAGTYSIAFRVASPSGSTLQVRSGTAVLATLDIPQTNGWNIWTTTTANVNLPAGGQTLRLYALTDGFIVNWLEFSKSSVNLND